MNILLLGKNGQVGWELDRALQPLGNVISLDRSGADFSEPESLRKIVQDCKPDVIVNAVAYTAVDKAEEEEALAETINSITPGVLGEEALKLSALLVHFSTDYVFDGQKNGPFTEDDATNPLNAYGRTKLKGEVAIQSSGCEYLIFRTSWVYASRGRNFLLTILRLAKEKENLSIIMDQVGAPTPARLIADTTSHCVLQAAKERQEGEFYSGLFNLTASNKTSWYEFASAIVDIANISLSTKFKLKTIKAIPATEYPAPAKRPMNSQLSLCKIENKFNLKMPDWKKALSLCIEELK